jgi:hypothetical protein
MHSGGTRCGIEALFAHRIRVVLEIVSQLRKCPQRREPFKKSSAEPPSAPAPAQEANPPHAVGPETFLPTQEELDQNRTERATTPSRRWRRWRWTSRSPRRRHPATRALRRGRGGTAAGRGCDSTTCSTSTTSSSRSDRRPTTSTALRPSATT